MATTIKSSDLDFDAIKLNLKNHFKNTDEFKDYDFEASGLSNILDVLAYNTHVNALTANYALNESFLQTAQLRSSVVSHAETLGYDVRSKTGAVGFVNISTNLSAVAQRPVLIELEKGTEFTGTVDGVSHTFRTTENYFARDNGFGFYDFKTNDGSVDIPITEGTERVKTFLAGEKNERTIYIIPDKNLDKSTIVIRVFDTAVSSSFTSYAPIKQAVEVDANSTFFTVNEAPNGFYEINFGDGISFGKAPEPGNKIEVTYLTTVGPDANDAGSFTANSPISIAGQNYSLTVVTASNSAGGADKQSMESIKQLAPFAYASQQRLVTSLDYKSTILSNYTSVEDCAVWSGDQNVPIDYGKVYVSLSFDPNTTTASRDAVKNSIKTNFTKNLAVMSIDTVFTEPVNTFIELTTNFQFDPALTGSTVFSTESEIYNFKKTYFTNNLGKFDAVYRRSNLLTEIDALSPAILSTRQFVKAQLRFSPTVGANTDHRLAYPMKIATPDDIQPIVTTSTFQFKNKVALIKNRLNSTILQIEDLKGNVLLDNVGEYRPQDGVVDIVAINPEALLFGVSFLKVSVIPQDESVIRPLRNYILTLDEDISSATAIIDRQTTTLEIDA